MMPLLSDALSRLVSRFQNWMDHEINKGAKKHDEKLRALRGPFMAKSQMRTWTPSKGDRLNSPNVIPGNH